MLPLFSLRLQEELGFAPVPLAWACATQSVAALVGPLIAGQVADRWFPAERCLAVCAFSAGVFLWVLAELTTPVPVFAVSLAFWLVMIPVLTLGLTLTFTHVPDPGRDFGPVRLWGTVGWVLPGWLLGYWFANPAWLRPVLAWLRPARPQGELADAFRLAGLVALALSACAWTLPHTPPQRRGSAALAPLVALRLLRGRTVAVYALCTLGVCITTPFTTQVLPLLLVHLGIPRPWLGPTLTIAQSTEMLSLALLPMLLVRLGLRGTMVLGIVAWAVGLSVLTVGRPVWLVISSLTMNGVCMCCFLMSGQLFINSKARGDVRASAQALLMFLSGLGQLGGNLLVGWVRRWARGDFSATFAVGAGLAILLVLVFLVGFSDEA
jgi:predicted MFS family arabinose efflux permease